MGRDYEAVIRVNSQSGKGGVAYIMEYEHGFELPRRLQIEFSRSIQTITEDTGTEISPTAMWDTFTQTYLPEEPSIELRSHEVVTDADEVASLTAQLLVDGEPITISGPATGRSTRSSSPLRAGLGLELDVVDYHEHAIGAGADAKAVAYVETVDAEGVTRWGIGTHPNIVTASLRAVLSAAERSRRGDQGR